MNVANGLRVNLTEGKSFSTKLKNMVKANKF